MTNFKEQKPKQGQWIVCRNPKDGEVIAGFVAKGMYPVTKRPAILIYAGSEMSIVSMKDWEWWPLAAIPDLKHSLTKAVKARDAYQVSMLQARDERDTKEAILKEIKAIKERRTSKYSRKRNPNILAELRGHNLLCRQIHNIIRGKV